jgi:hypothetical protein
MYKRAAPFIVGLLLLAPRFATASELLIFTRNANEVAAKESKVAAVAVFLGDLVNVDVDFSQQVLNTAKPAVEERFAAYDIPATVVVEDYALPYDAKCFAGEGEPMRTTSYVLPKGEYWALHVTTTGALGWLGNISGLTKKNVFAGFHERGVDVAICPLK